MTNQPNYTLPNPKLEKLATKGLKALQELIQILASETMRLKREHQLRVGSYERSP